MLQAFWRDGLFDDMDRRYFRLIDRSGGSREGCGVGAIGHYSDDFVRLLLGVQERLKVRAAAGHQHDESGTHIETLSADD